MHSNALMNDTARLSSQTLAFLEFKTTPNTANIAKSHKTRREGVVHGKYVDVRDELIHAQSKQIPILDMCLFDLISFAFVCCFWPSSLSSEQRKLTIAAKNVLIFTLNIELSWKLALIQCFCSCWLSIRIK